MEASSFHFEKEQSTYIPSPALDYLHIVARSTILCVHYGMMDPATGVQELYIVPKDVYEHCDKKAKFQEKLETLPKRPRSYANRIITHLRPILEWDYKSGEVSGLSENLFSYLNYSTRGKQRPEDWELFLPHLYGLPQSLFCAKVRREVKSAIKAEKRHGRQLHKAGLDELLPAGSA